MGIEVDDRAGRSSARAVVHFDRSREGVRKDRYPGFGLRSADRANLV